MFINYKHLIIKKDENKYNSVTNEKQIKYIIRIIKITIILSSGVSVGKWEEVK